MTLVSMLVMVSMLALMPVSVFAQARATGADLDGTVSDQTGAVVPGCAISVTNLDTNVTRTVAADDIGHYSVPALPPGSYSIRAELTGFRTQTRERVDLLLGEAFRIDFALSLEAATDAITVDAPPSVVSLNRSTVSTVIQQQQIDALPINGRNFISFALITPGVATDRTPLQGAASTSGLSFTGQRGRSNNVTVDGLDNNDPVMGSVRAIFSQEAVREFQVLVDSYSAEFGKASGGVVNIVTKSGTNTAHGGAFLYLRDKALNSRGYFDKYDVFGRPVDLDKPPYSQKQWGGTFGGPVRRDRTFAFLSFEQLNVRDARVVTIDPTAAALLQSEGFPVDLGLVPLRVRNSEALAKVDHHWTPVRTLTVRGTYADIDREGIDDFGGNVARSRGSVQLRTDWSLSGAETDVLSNRWLNELRVQFAYENQHVNSLDPLCGGPCENVDEGGPTLELTGVAFVGRQRFSPQVRLNKRLQLSDTVSYSSGAHHIKIGADYNHIAFPGDGNLLPSHFGGRYVFSAIPPLGVTSAIDGLQKGIPAAYIQGYGTAHYPDEGYNDLALFAQDEWTRGRLTIRPGLRYQRQFWQPMTYHASDLAGGTITYPLPSDGNNLAPRIGASYDLRGDGRTILHGAYGLFYDNIITIAESPSRLLTGDANGLRTLALLAPLASLAWNAPQHRLTEAQSIAVLGGPYVSAVAVGDPALKASFSHQASAGVDRAISGDLSLRASLLYVRGFNLPGTFDFNPVLPARLGTGRRPNDAPCATNPAAPCVNGGIPGTSTSVIQTTSFGESWYTGLALAVHKRFSGRSQFLLSYTLSKAEDTSTDFGSQFIVQNNGYGRNPDDPSGLPLGFDPDSERGPATHDQRHRFVASGVYQFPWRVSVSGILTAASGRPFTPLAGADLNGDGNGGQFPPDRARRNPADEATSVGRNRETTVKQLNVDLRVSRTFRFGARGTLEAMVEAFNLFNRVNFIEDTNQSSFVIFGTGAFPSNPLPAYGRYTLTLPPRQVQVALKVGF
jgi:hypothetical protein